MSFPRPLTRRRTPQLPGRDAARREHGLSGHGLTDDALTVGASARSVSAYLREAVDRLAGADPGLTQLRNALQAVLGIGLAVGVVDLFVHLTGALQMSAGSGPAPVVAAYNHALLIVSMLLSGMVAMMAGFTVSDSTARGQLISSLILPIPMLASMACGLAIGSYRVPSLIFLVVLLAGAVYVRRWGPRGFGCGLVAFNGGFLGFFLHAEIGLRDIGWLAADLFIGLLASLAVRFALFRPDLGRTLVRMRRSWEARARRLLTLSIAILDSADGSDGSAGSAGSDGSDGDGSNAGNPSIRTGISENGGAERATLVERLRRQVVRLNESTLMIDAQLAQATPRSAGIEARRLFDAELALSNCARFASALVTVGAGQEMRRTARDALSAVLAEDRESAAAATTALRSFSCADTRLTVLCHRLGSSIDEYQRARGRLHESVTELLDPDLPDAGDGTEFVPAVALNAGFLPGSVPVSTAASTTPGRGGGLDRAAMPPYVRAAIQAGSAGTIAVIVGDLVSGPRLYWAVLATFLAFMATTNSGEQVRKALFRVSGTAIGIVVGDLLVRLTGGYVWTSLAIVLVALFFGIYLIRINYTFMVIGITVTMSQLYKQLGEFSWHLLVLRLGETAIGVGAVVVTVLFIVPLRPQRVLTTGVLLWFRALTAVLDAALDQLLGAPSATLRPAVRSLDAAYAALEATATPLRRATFGRNSAQLTEIQSVSGAARSYARSLAVAVETMRGTQSPELARAADQLRASSAAIEARIATGEHGVYVRAAALIDVAAHSQVIVPTGATGAPDVDVLPLALRDLTLLDGVLARLALALQMDVEDHDTTAPAGR